MNERAYLAMTTDELVSFVLSDTTATARETVLARALSDADERIAALESELAEWQE